MLQAQTSAWEKGRLSSTGSPHPLRASAPRAVEDIRQPPPNMWSEPRPSPHSLAQVGVLITGGLLVEETEGQRGETHPAQGHAAPGIKVKSRL